ncbi:hypothetical protein [Nonomuraea sp. KM88]
MVANEGHHEKGLNGALDEEKETGVQRRQHRTAVEGAAMGKKSQAIPAR